MTNTFLYMYIPSNIWNILILKKKNPLYIWNSNLTRSPVFYFTTLVGKDPWAFRALGRRGRRAASSPWLIYSWLCEIQRNDLRSQNRRKTRERSGWRTIRIHSIQPISRSVFTETLQEGRCKGHEVTDNRSMKEAAQRRDRGGSTGVEDSQIKEQFSEETALF